MTTFKSQATQKSEGKEFVPVRAQNIGGSRHAETFLKENKLEKKTFVGGVLASKSKSQQKKDIVASDKFYSSSILSSKEPATKDTTTLATNTAPAKETQPEDITDEKTEVTPAKETQPEDTTTQATKMIDVEKNNES